MKSVHDDQGSAPAGPRLTVRIERASLAVRALSPREREVLGHISRGMSNKDVAAALGLTFATVRTFVERIFAKLEVRSRAAACTIWTLAERQSRGS